ncbi:LPS-assembly protein LptD @ Organic solvent tolerance protein precursor [hydrothermal vent metagenome]|uniref:LPS-assembly protein LptD @ Organic solvent tolerance protein n=1 Tax=hydrothermal vent metagenome TaxID=652676 RepID=A0A3B0Y0U0_9ZZZZ
MILKHLCLYSILLATWPPLLWANNLDYNALFRQCPADSATLLTHHAPPAFSASAIDTTDISAEQVINSGKTTSIFSGNVLIERHLLRLQTDQATYSRDTQRVDISGNIHIDTESMALSANKGWLNLLNNEGEFNASTYYIPEAHLSGSTPVIRVTADNRTILTDTQFTTCPLNQPDWSLGASTLILDQNEATGTAKHTVFRLKGVPLLYFPWIQFPLGDERRSGFLIPSIGISSSRGLELAAPIYWNIAPNQDAIITPRYMRERGTMLATDYRYLTRSSQGVFNFEYLNNDAQFDEQAPDKILFDKQRYLIHFKNQSKITDNLSLSLLANTVSDDEYLRDMGSNIGVSNVTHLEKNANLKYTFDNWNAGLLTQSFETIDTTLTNRPYQRLPQITLRGKEELLEIDNGYLQGSLESEWVEFAHENAAKKQGSRFFAYPKLSLPIEGNAWFIKPTAGYYYSQYDITENDDKLDIEDRGLSVLSLDSGLFFEKDYASSSLIQTLEPRLYYLNVPFEDQAAIPPFDTSEQSFSFSSLFRENRFTGIDRIGDANQLTLALSSRMLNSDNGHELMNFSIGRIFYFDKQRVTLTDTADPADTSANASDIIAELGFNLNRWKARATTQWNRQTNEADKRNILLSYAASEKAVFNMGYRFFRDPRDDNLEQTDVSFAWPFARNYALLGRWNYSLTEQRNLQTLIGLEYESCCWALRLVSQRYITDDTEDRTNFMFQLVLKGFGGSANKKTTNSLKFAIPGYQPDF